MAHAGKQTRSAGSSDVAREAAGGGAGKSARTDGLEGGSPRASGFVPGSFEIAGDSPVHISSEGAVARYRVTNPDAIPGDVTIGWLFPNPVDHRKDEVAHVDSRKTSGFEGEFALRGWKLGGGRSLVQAIAVRDRDSETLDRKTLSVQVNVTDDSAGRAWKRDAAARAAAAATARRPSPKEIGTGDWIAVPEGTQLWEGDALEGGAGERNTPGEVASTVELPEGVTRGRVVATAIVGDARYLEADFYAWDVESQHSVTAAEHRLRGWVLDEAAKPSAAPTFDEAIAKQIQKSLDAIIVESSGIYRASKSIARGIESVIKPGETGTIDVAVRYGPPQGHLLIGMKVSAARSRAGGASLGAGVSLGIEGQVDLGIAEAAYKVGGFMNLTSKADSVEEALNLIWLNWRTLLIARGGRKAADWLMSEAHATRVLAGMDDDDTVEFSAGLEASASIGTKLPRNPDGTPGQGPKAGFGAQASAGITSTLSKQKGKAVIKTGNKLTAGISISASGMGVGACTIALRDGAFESFTVALTTDPVDGTKVRKVIDTLAGTLGSHTVRQLIASIGDDDPRSEAIAAAAVDDLRTALRDRAESIAKGWLDHLPAGLAATKRTYSIALVFVPAGITLSVSATSEVSIGGATTIASVRGARAEELFSIQLPGRT